MFANRYLEKNRNMALVPELPHPETGMIVVIPCYLEPEILKTLHSLKNCILPEKPVEVLILINHSEIAPENIKSFNFNTKREIESQVRENQPECLRFFAVGPVELQKKWAGAGLARKRGMDEAVRRFNLLEKPDGLIVSLDADTLVKENYLREIENFFRENPKNIGATISFQHQTSGLSAKHLQGIQLYENYLWYYKEAMHFAGYPHSLFTVGSAFAVTAGAYVKRGGMNRRQAGEDFYFLQNLAQMGRVGEITSTKVYPSARLSDRVPFGTGPVLQKWLNGEDDLTQTYNFKAFQDLKIFFDQKDKMFQMPKAIFSEFVSQLPKPVGSFLVHDDFWKELADLNKNCSSLETFQNRFFQKFNAFKILKFLNFGHGRFYKKASLDEQVNSLERTIQKTKNKIQ